jgi:hypothetical protein
MSVLKPGYNRIVRIIPPPGTPDAPNRARPTVDGSGNTEAAPAQSGAPDEAESQAEAVQLESMAQLAISEKGQAGTLEPKEKPKRVPLSNSTMPSLSFSSQRRP